MLLAAAVRKKIMLCDAVRENSSLPALPCAQGSAGSEKFSRTASTGEANFTVMISNFDFQFNCSQIISNAVEFKYYYAKLVQSPKYKLFSNPKSLK